MLIFTITLLTADFEIVHYINDGASFNLLFIKKIKNVDNFIKFRGEKGNFIVWIHGKGGNLWRQKANQVKTIFSVVYILYTTL